MAKTSEKEEETLIKDLKYEKQMENLEPWIKALYKQTEKDPNNPNGWSKWSLRPSKKVDSSGTLFIGGNRAIALDGGNRQEYLDNLIKLESDKDWEKFGSLLCLTEEEKRFVFLCNQFLGLELTTGEFLRMSSTDRQKLYDQVTEL